MSLSKNDTSPSYRLSFMGVVLSSAINVAGSVGSFTGRSPEPGKLTDDG